MSNKTPTQSNKALFWFIAVVLVASCALLVAGLLPHSWEWLHVSEEKVVVLDVGQGDSILLQTTAREQILVDGGPSNDVLFGLGEHMPFFDRTIEMIVLTHPDADHVTGLVEVLRRYEVQQIVATGVVHTLPAYTEFWNEIAKQQIPVTEPQINDEYVFENLKLRVLWPEDDLWGKTPHSEMNDTSIVLRAEYGDDFSVLLTGDVTKDVEDFLVQLYGDELHSTVLKVGHHGSKTSSDPVFVKTVDPEIAVISAARDNRYGHPHFQVTYTLEQLDIFIKSTAIEGDVVIVP